MQQAKITRKCHAKRPTHAQLVAGLTPIISRGPFRLVWSNPCEPVEIPEEEDWDPQDRFDPETGEVIGHYDE
jgi:hypothetical protein